MKRFVLLIALAVLAVGAANADNWPFNSSAVESGNVGVQVYHRYWIQGAPIPVNNDCVDTCVATGYSCEDFEGQTYCLTPFAAKGLNGYRSYDSNPFNWNDQPNGTVFQSLFEYQTASGLHTGYYAWVSGPVTVGETSAWNAAGCAGGNGQSCLGQATAANAMDVLRVPGGDRLNVGGFSPLPVPRGARAATGTYQLDWDAVTSVGDAPGGTPVGYDIYVNKAAASGNACPAPNRDQVTFVKTVTGVNATVTDAEIGGPADCVTFALKVRFGTSGDGPVISRFVSAFGQTFSNSPLSSDVYDITARWLRANNVEVTWKTSLEDGVRGFYVSRSTSLNGQYERVSDLIQANGEPSSYNFIDTLTVTGKVTASGLFYKIESVDIDDQIATFGPVKAQMPKPGKDVIKNRKTR